MQQTLALFTEPELLAAGLGVDEAEGDAALAGELFGHGELGSAELGLVFPRLAMMAPCSSSGPLKATTRSGPAGSSTPASRWWQ